jgi:NAD(P)-dependent dehydrogenase (short-subunit alcohol dehydrogenase family)
LSGLVLLLGTDAAELAGPLTDQGYHVETAGDPGTADALVTLAPRAERRLLAELDSDAWRAAFRAWAEEPFFAAQQFLRAAYERGSGCWIAVTSSIATQPFPGLGAAGASAMALHTLVRVAAVEGGPRGVRANVLASGWREDALPPELDPELAVADTPTRRLAALDDLAAALAFFLSPAAEHITGEVLRVDGGYTITRGSRPDPTKE